MEQLGSWVAQGVHCSAGKVVGGSHLGEMTGQDLDQVGELRCKSKQEELQSCADFKGETWGNVFRLKFCLPPVASFFNV